MGDWNFFKSVAISYTYLRSLFATWVLLSFTNSYWGLYSIRSAIENFVNITNFLNSLSMKYYKKISRSSYWSQCCSIFFKHFSNYKDQRKLLIISFNFKQFNCELIVFFALNPLDLSNLMNSVSNARNVGIYQFYFVKKWFFINRKCDNWLENWKQIFTQLCNLSQKFRTFPISIFHFKMINSLKKENFTCRRKKDKQKLI